MQISLVGVLLAAISAMVVGSLWYNPSTFMPRWQKLTGTSDAHLKKAFPMAMVAMFVAALVTAYVLAHFMQYSSSYTAVTGVRNGLETAFWLWLGISLTTVVTSGALEDRDSTLMWIQAGNRLVTLLVMGIILGLFM